MRDKLSKLKHMLLSPSLQSLWRWSKSYRLQMFLLTLGQAVSAVLGLVFTLVTKNVIDAAVEGSFNKIRLYAISLVCLIIVQLLFSYVLRIAYIKVTTLYRQKMRAMMIGKILGKQYSEIANEHSGALTGKVLTDTNTVSSAVVSIVPSLIFLLTQFIGAAVILFRFSPLFVMILIAICLVGAVFMMLIGNRMKKYHKDAREKEDGVLSSVTETMQNIRIIKASEIEKNAKAKIWSKQEEYVKAELKKGRFGSAANTGIGFIFRFTWLYAMLWGCFGIFKGTLSYGMLTAMLQLVGQVQGPIQSLAGLVSELYGAVSSAERLDELIAKKDEADFDIVDEGIRGNDLYYELEEIRVEKLSFSYGRENVMTDKSFVIKPGDIMAITGHSGCGKSTFFLLTMGLYEPTEGKIVFKYKNGQTDTAGRKTRKMFAYVPQGNALFSGSIRDNVVLFRKDATDEEVWNALKMACIDEFIEGLDNGIETYLGERGLGLSEGQAQRIAIARAFLSKAPILLLDEATSALDDKTEAKVLENIAGLEGKTCLVVTHRPAALKICNRHMDFEE